MNFRNSSRTIHFDVAVAKTSRLQSLPPSRIRIILTGSCVSQNELNASAK